MTHIESPCPALSGFAQERKGLRLRDMQRLSMSCRLEGALQLCHEDRGAQVTRVVSKHGGIDGEVISERDING